MDSIATAIAVVGMSWAICWALVRVAQSDNNTKNGAKKHGEA